MNHSPSSMGDIKLTYRFILIGLFSFILYNLLFFQGTYHLAEGIYRVNDIWVLVHTFILGFIMMVVMGVMYQLIPVALLVSIYSNRLSKIQFWTYATGVIGFLIGLWTVNTSWMAIFGTLTFIGVLLFVANMLLSVKKLIQWNTMALIIVTAVFYLFNTVLFGLLLALNYRFAWFANAHEQLLYAHILFGVVGWLSSVIIGFSYKMAPMFSLAHGYSEKYAKWIYAGIQLGLVLLVVGIFTNSSFLNIFGALSIAISFYLFGYQIHEIMKHKMKSTLDIGFQVAVYAVYGSLLLIGLAIILYIFLGGAILLPFAYFFIMGWIGFSILGYLYKIVPFLYWTDKYSEKVGKEPVPMLKDLVSEQKGKIAFSLLFIGLLANGIGIGLQSVTFIWISNSIYTAGSLYYGYLILKVFKA